MKKFKKIGKISMVLVVLFTLFYFGIYFVASISSKLDINTANGYYLYDKDTNLINGTSDQWIKLENISDNLINATISIEDKSFYKHQGFDFLRIAKSLYINLINRKTLQGASTITQQYAKNLFLDFDKTWQRKIEEAFLTLRLEVQYSKDEILEGYLNTINFGQGNYGIENASEFYFNKSAKDLNLEEAIILAGIPKAPNKYNPVTNYDASLQRGKVIAKLMYNNEKIEGKTYDNLFKNKLDIYGKRNENDLNMLMYYQDAVYQELETLEEIPDSLMESGGIKIYTSLNMEAQSLMEKNINEYMKNEKMQVASIIINPHNGGVMALSGGVDYTKSQFNRAISSTRQVGSAIKPFLYYSALENGMVSSSTFLSEPTTFMFSSNNSYSPANYNDKYGNKDITMAAALAYSDNIYAVKTHLFLGEDTLVNTAKKMGITGELVANPSLALGTSELNMLDYINGYTTLANGGYTTDNYFIEKVEDLNGNVLYEHKNKKKMVLNSNYVYILNEMLTNTSNSKFQSYISPTALSIANKMSKKYALKTGTTKTDYWTVGYNPDGLLMIWLGYDDAREIGNETSRWAKNIWIETMEDYLKDTEAHWYDTPENIVGILRDPVTGEPVKDGNAAVFYYVKGSEGNTKSVDINTTEE